MEELVLVTVAIKDVDFDPIQLAVMVYHDHHVTPFKQS
jgi:hypothetical protein